MSTKSEAIHVHDPEENLTKAWFLLTPLEGENTARNKKVLELCTGVIKDSLNNSAGGNLIPAYKYRGIARRYLGQFQDSTADLKTAIKLSHDKEDPEVEADLWLELMKTTRVWAGDEP